MKAEFRVRGCTSTTTTHYMKIIDKKEKKGLGAT